MKRLIKIADIKHEVLVRVGGLDEGRVKMFCELLLNEADLPPIRITKENVLVDGRHRVEANTRVGNTEIQAETVPIKERNEIVLEAWRANTGGALPPSAADVAFNIKQLLKGGMKRKAIVDALESQIGIPRALASKWVDTQQTDVTRKLVDRAHNAVVNDGITTAEAAEKFGVKEDAVKKSLGGKKTGTTPVHSLRGTMALSFKKITASTGQYIKHHFAQYTDGNVSHQDMLSLLDEYDLRIGNLQDSSRNWRERIALEHKRQEDP